MSKKKRQARRKTTTRVKRQRIEFVARPFEGLPNERGLVAMTQIIPAATATARLTQDHGGREVQIVTLLPDLAQGMRRADGEVYLVETNEAVLAAMAGLDEAHRAVGRVHDHALGGHRPVGCRDSRNHLAVRDATGDEGRIVGTHEHVHGQCRIEVELGRLFGASALLDAVLVEVEAQTAHEQTADGLQTRAGQNALGRAARPYVQIDSRTGHGRGNGPEHVPVVDEADTGADIAHGVYELGMATISPPETAKSMSLLEWLSPRAREPKRRTLARRYRLAYLMMSCRMG